MARVLIGVALGYFFKEEIRDFFLKAKDGAA